MRYLPLAASAAFVFLQAASPPPIEAQTNPKIAVHLQTHSSKSACGDADPVVNGIPCSAFTTAGELKTGYDLYLVVSQADSLGVAGATFGICYNGNTTEGVDVVSWNLCASGLEFPQTGWPDAVTGNVITWNVAECGDTRIDPDGVHGTLGAFYVYAYSRDIFAVTPHLGQEGGPKLKVANCNGAEKDLDPQNGVLGWAGFGGDPGCNPCTAVCPTDVCPVPVEPVTWGGIKTKYD